jgi:phospholipid/cholesterol/gamma-HCH transport system ATP-binding protein
MLEFRNVTFSYSQEKLFQNLSLSFRDQKITCIFGFSGSGKSSLLKLILDFYSPQKGDLFVFDQLLSSIQNIHEYRRHYGVIFQYGALFDSLNVLDNVAFPLKEIYKYTYDQYLPIVKNLILQVGLTENDLCKSIHSLSGGMRRRVAIARALILKPKVLLCDEPTTGLDPISTRQILQLIKEKSQQEKLTTLLISHDIREALKIADDVLFLEKGSVVEYCSKEDFINTKNSTLQEFMK